MIKVQHKQELVDIALQAQGDATTLFELAVLNNKSITGALTAGDEVEVAEAVTATAKRIARVLGSLVPASIGEPSMTVNGLMAFIAPTSSSSRPVALQNQMLVDLAMQMAGDTARLFELAALNNKAITDNMEAGASLDANTGDLSASAIRVAQLLNGASNRPASGDGLKAATGLNGSFVLRRFSEAPAGQQVQRGQALVDMAMQHKGDAGLLYSLAASLNLDITAFLTAGDYLAIERQGATAQNNKMVSLLNKRDQWPASDFDRDGPPLTPKLEGIDYWFVWEYVVQ